LKSNNNNIYFSTSQICLDSIIVDNTRGLLKIEQYINST
jgi:hypothetical protein